MSQSRKKGITLGSILSEIALADKTLMENETRPTGLMLTCYTL